MFVSFQSAPPMVPVGCRYPQVAQRNPDLQGRLLLAVQDRSELIEPSSR
jgi:hypothetical protein